MDTGGVSAIQAPMEPIIMDTTGGQLHCEQPIPRVHHVRLPGERMVDLMRRAAHSVAFAFHLDPEVTAAQTDLEYSAETAVLLDGVISRSVLRGAVTLARDAERVAATGADQLFIILVEAGTVDVQPTRSGRRLREGDILILDLKKAATLVNTDYTAMMVVISRSLLPKAARNLDLHCTEIRADHPLARVITSTTHRLWEDSRRMTPAQGSVVFQGVIEILGLALTDTRRARGEEMSLRAGAEAIVDDHLKSAGLTPASIAERLGVSRATLYRTFAPYGGVARFIDERRLQRAWTLVSSPVGPPIAEVASLCGYASKARLTRAFVSRLNATPDAVRAATGEARDRLNERAALEIMDSWDRRSGRATATPEPAVEGRYRPAPRPLDSGAFAAHP
ncbi:helix-turn-helix domain-containing protein [Brevundimonas sp.]|uniref:helix-turn-helix domain-containing protein n=1 Tax=Brevundimonas sp. TaxID=1871086 RepID=UPI003D6CB180